MSNSDQKQGAAADEIGDDWGAALAEQASAEAEAALDPDAILAEAGSASGLQTPGVQADPYLPSALEPGGGASSLGEAEENLKMILEIPVTLSVEVGRARIPIRNLLQLSQGSVVELDRLAGEPMDVMINGTLVARGEVVVVNDKYGIRLTEIISHADRIKRLAS